MKKTNVFLRAVSWLVIGFMALPMEVMAQGGGASPAPAFKQAELEQILAPVALYPDDVLSQILMASTYPLEIVEADRWAKQNSGLKGDALAAALEKQRWDPSVKSLVNFPQVLSMMSEKLDWTNKLGDAFLSQQQDVMKTVQVLRRKAEQSGNLKTTKEQKVIVEKETIIIQPANPQVVYVPTYNPVVVYGAWPYPAYPPYYYYPPGYVATASAFSFAAGVAVGAAWGYAWGNCNWHGGDVNINVNKNANINNTINRNAYANKYQGGKGTWQHDPSHRQNVAYRDKSTAQRYGQSGARTAEGRRDARGYGSAGTAGQRSAGQGADKRGSQQTGRSGGSLDKGKSGMSGSGRSGEHSSAFSGVGNGSREMKASDRGMSSRSQSFQGAGSSMGGGGLSHGSGGGGFSRRGGGRR
ncbi:MAG: DUF3300 domain-containing protein [Geobacteraceae bacterium]|nr:DUF3300 domain-containing protein [Geobacteraceae bacterium]